MMKIPEKSAQAYRTLGPHEVDNLFVRGLKFGRVCISPDNPIVGEVIVDRFGLYYLSPEEDYRGGEMGAIRVRGQNLGKFTRKVVKITGIYTDDEGLTVEQICLENQSFKAPENGG